MILNVGNIILPRGVANGLAGDPGRMTPKPHCHPGGFARSGILRRLVWVGMLVLHVIALGYAIPRWGIAGEHSSGSLRVVSLSLANIFLVLKVIDVRWLRVVPGWRSVVASITLMALLHVMVVERASNGAISAEKSGSVVLAVVGVTAAADTLKSVLKHLSVRPFADAQSRDPIRFALGWFQALGDLVLPAPAFVAPQFAARPPPRA